MFTSLLVTFVGIQAAFLFAQYGTIYEAHGAFHSVVTPPMVTVIFLGIFWQRFSSRAAVLTFVLGAAFIFLGIQYPQIFVQPFSHGIEYVEAKPWSYIRALYNVVACTSIGIIVTLLTSKPNQSHYEQIKGLTLWTIKDGPTFFKGSEVNENAGSKITFDGDMIKVVDDTDNKIYLPADLMKDLGAKEGDFAYISDTRWYLGGIKSTHAYIGKMSSSNKIEISKNVQNHGQFDPSKKLFIELEL